MKPTKTYHYSGLHLGQKVQGHLSASNKKQALSLLKQKRIFIAQISVVNQSALFASIRYPADKQVHLFTQKLAVMTTAGLPLVESFALASAHSKHPRLKHKTTKALNQLKSGIALSEALSGSTLFDNAYLNMIKAGELTGDLALFLTKLTDTLEKKLQTKSGIKTALSYPVILLITALIITLFMLLNVVPTFEKMYANMNVSLPLVTQSLIAAGGFLSQPVNLLTIVGSVLLLVIGGRYLLTIERVKSFSDSVLLTLPLFGPMIRQAAIARIALLIGHLLSAGISMVDALEVVQQTSKNRVFMRALNQIRHGVLTGKKPSVMFAEQSIFPNDFAHLLTVGEQTGQADAMFASLAQYYQNAFDTTVKRLSALIEPVMILLIGGLIAVLMIALYLPIFSAGSLVS